jgi:hypothetical protein
MSSAPSAPAIPVEEQGLWRAYLQKDERLIWTGRPAGGLRLRRSDRLVVPASLLVGLVAVLSLRASPLSERDGTGLLFGLSTIAFALWLLVGRHLYDALQRGFMRYALTDRRALILRRLLFQRLESWPIGPFMPIDYRPGALWHIYFAKFYTDVGETRTLTRVGFEFIPDGEHVKAMVERIQRDAAEANA